MMTPEQRRLIEALGRVSFVPGTASKRIVREAYDRPEMSERMERCLWRIAYTFRRQLPRDIAEEAVRRKVDHCWVMIGEPKYLLKCSVCGKELWHRKNDQTPCPGPPEPKKTRARKATA